MIYVYHDSKLDLYLSFSNIKAVSKHTGISYDTLIYNFNRVKKDSYHKNSVIITKTNPISK